MRAPQKAELVTPTGALLITGYAQEFGGVPPMRAARRPATAPASRDFADTPNVLRVLIGEADTAAAPPHGRRHRGGDRRHEPADLRRAHGSAARRGRARRVLHVDPDEEEPAGHAAHDRRAPGRARAAHRSIVFRETTTIGVRYREMDRECLDRETSPSTTPFGRCRHQGGAAERRGDERCRRSSTTAPAWPREQRPARQGRPGAGDEGVSLDAADDPLRHEAVLHHHADLLHQRAPAHRPRLYDDGGRRDRPIAAPAGR